MTRRFNNICVLKGGVSSEREISLRSGSAIANGLREAGYVVNEIDVVSREINIPSATDAVFIALHGSFGEDGGVQKILDKLQIPYTGSGYHASKIAFDKELTKKLFVQEGIYTPKYQILASKDEEIEINLPFVVKPLRQGSSIGIHKIRDNADIQEALNDSFKYGDKVLVEEYIEGRELTVGVLVDKVLPVVEIKVSSEWYDYNAKYVKGKTNYIVPAKLEEQELIKCKEIALKTFRSLECEGFGRVDIRLSALDGLPYVLEMNTIPGFTETSLLPKSAKAAGIEFSELCDIIINTATYGDI